MAESWLPSNMTAENILRAGYYAAARHIAEVNRMDQTAPVKAPAEPARPRPALRVVESIGQ